MSVLISGMTAEELLDVFQWARTGANNCMIGHGVVATELPDHGDLIDESETVEAQYYDDEHEEWSIKTKTVGDVLAEICEVPPKVVIPAERSEE